jgi:outer membrane protein assembly factor BamB
VDGSPVVTMDQVVHVGSLDGKLYSLDLATGKQLGVLELDDGISASPAISNGRLVIGTQKGSLYCLEKE